MSTRLNPILAPLALTLGLAAPAQAIVINDTAGLATSAALGGPFASVTRITFTNTSGSFLCSGALISATAVLTADHCARGFGPADITVRFTNAAGTTTEIQRAVSAVHTFGDPSTGQDLLNGSDLAVLTMASGVTNRLPFQLYDGSVIGDLARFVGYGRSGVGSTGSTGASGGARRAAETVVDWYGMAKNCGGAQGFCNRAGTTNILSADFDNPAGTANPLAGSIVGSSAFMTVNEGTTASGDSGGPLLVLREDAWLIAGVTSGGSSSNSVYGDLAWWTAVASPAARSFVESHGGAYWSFSEPVDPDPDPDPGPGDPAVVPVPAAGGLMLLALALLGSVARARAGRTRPAPAG